MRFASHTALLLTLFASGCADSHSSEDGGIRGMDASRDAGRDAGQDAGVDEATARREVAAALCEWLERCEFRFTFPSGYAPDERWLREAEPEWMLLRSACDGPVDLAAPDGYLTCLIALREVDSCTEDWMAFSRACLNRYSDWEWEIIPAGGDCFFQADWWVADGVALCAGDLACLCPPEGCPVMPGVTGMYEGTCGDPADDPSLRPWR